ncbi:MAG: DUF3048 domain-containing protein, partial [Carbonactinosporaceae bacterium]
RDGARGPVLAVKVDNASLARPHRGLTKADIVYVEPVEGEISRILAVFSSTLPETVGPIRSARQTDIKLLRQFGRPALAYSGAHPGLLPLLHRAHLAEVSPTQAGGAYLRGGSRPAPHNLYAHPRELLRGKASRVGKAHDIGFRFGPEPSGGTRTKRYSVRYRAASFTFTWAHRKERFEVSMDGAPAMAAEGGRLGARTVVIQGTTIRGSRFRDVAGNVSPYAETVGSGTAVVLRDGKRYQARWKRPSPQAGTTFTTPSGEPMRFDRGNVWVVLARR